MSTVVLLGAGASAGSKYALPVMQGFVERSAVDAYPHLLDFICNHCFGASNIWHTPDLEETMTHLQLLEHGFPWADPETAFTVAQVHAEMDKYVFMRLVTKPLGTVDSTDYVPLFECPDHRQLFALLEKNDSILTLNYDLVADGTLYAIADKEDKGRLAHNSLLERSYRLLEYVRLIHGERPTSLRSQASLGYYIKLHGSVDWYYCPNPACPYHSVFFQNWPRVPDVHVQPTDPCFLCGSKLVRAMIPPSLGKVLDEFPKMRLLWNLAFRKLSEAARWIVVGVSLAPSDFYLRTLLREAATHQHSLELIVINPCKEHRGRIVDCIKPKVVSYADTLAEWLKENG